jgi:hypothetical protein
MMKKIIISTSCTQDTTVPDEKSQPSNDDIKEAEDNTQQNNENTDNESDNDSNKDLKSDSNNDSENDIDDDQLNVEDDSNKVVIENDAFQIFQPAPGAEVKEKIVIKGLARVFEGTVLYEFEDGHNILDEGFTTATEGALGWGEFEINIDIDEEVANNIGNIILYEESAEDGSRKNELVLTVKVIQ